MNSLPRTLSLARIAREFLGFEWPREWMADAIDCSKGCDGEGGWGANSCPECHGAGFTAPFVLPLDVPAGLAIARIRLGEVAPHVPASFVTAAEAQDQLRRYDPELA